MPNENRDEIGRIRELLIGEVQRDLERRITKLETHIASRFAELQQEVRRRTDVIEGHMRKEIDALSARLEGEAVERKGDLRALLREHREASSASEQRVAKLEESGVHAQHDLRSQILEQAKSFLDELHGVREEFVETLERELASFDADGAAEEPAPHEKLDVRETTTAR